MNPKPKLSKTLKLENVMSVISYASVKKFAASVMSALKKRSNAKSSKRLSLRKRRKPKERKRKKKRRESSKLSGPCSDRRTNPKDEK